MKFLCLQISLKANQIFDRFLTQLHSFFLGELQPVNLTRQSYRNVDFPSRTSLKNREVVSLIWGGFYFQLFDVCGGLRGLFQVHDGLRGHFQLLTLPLTIDNFEYKSVCMLKTACFFSEFVKENNQTLFQGKTEIGADGKSGRIYDRHHKILNKLISKAKKGC